MRGKQPVTENLPADQDYGPPTPWDDALWRLERAGYCWLATVRPDGRPHVRPVLAVWVGGVAYFASAEGSRKAKNLARNAKCSLSIGSVELPSLDLVLEGEARRATDSGTLERVADAYNSKYDWPVTAADGALDAAEGAPTAGPPPFNVYEFTPVAAFGFPGIAGTDEKGLSEHGMHSPTRWRFER